MAQTYGELMKEFNAISYSKDVFEIEKDSAELMIMEKYIENQLYIRENFNENVYVDYMLEKVDDGKLSSVFKRAKELATNVGEKVWKFFIRVMDMITSLISSVIKWVKDIYNKFTFKKTASILKEITSKSSNNTNIKESVDTLYIEKDTENTNKNEDKNNKNTNKDKNKTSALYSKVLDVFTESYQKSAKIFNDNIIHKLNTADLKNILDTMNIYVQSAKITDDANQTVESINYESGNIKKFFNVNVTNYQDKINLAKKFLNIINNEKLYVIFEVQNSDKFPLMSIDDYEESLYKLSNNCFNVPKSLTWLLKQSASIFGTGFAGYKMYTVFKALGLMASIKSFAYWYLGVFASIIIIDVIGKWLNKENKSINRLTIDIFNDGSKIYNKSMKISKNFNMTFEQILKELSLFADVHEKDFANNSTNTYFSKDNGNFTKLINSIKNSGTAVWTVLNYLGKNAPVAVTINGPTKNVDWKEILFTKSKNYEYIKKYSEIGINIMTLYNISASIVNELYKLSNTINKTYDEFSKKMNEFI